MGSSKSVPYGCLVTISGLPRDAGMPSLTWVPECQDGVLVQECRGRKKEMRERSLHIKICASSEPGFVNWPSLFTFDFHVILAHI